jgi:hypothetical protein
VVTSDFWLRKARLIFAALAIAGALLAPPLAIRAQESIAPATAWRDLDPATVLERIALGSCLDQARPQPIWKAVLVQRPQLFVMMGDNGRWSPLRGPAGAAPGLCRPGEAP